MGTVEAEVGQEVASVEPSVLDAAPLPPPPTLALDGRQVRLVRLALESLLWGTRREEHLTADVQALLARLPREQAREPLPSAGEARC